MKKYEAVVIGAGPAGYEAALKLSDAGVKTLLIERAKERIGGVCLNEGCIPTKSYLQSARYASEAAHFKESGVHVDTKNADMRTLSQKTTALKDELRSGVVWMLDKAKVEILYAEASFIDAYTIAAGGEKIVFEKCIIAAGSVAREIKELPIDGERIISSRHVFELKELPSSVTIVGGGAIACEFASFFGSFGVNVAMVLRGERLLENEDEEVSKALLRSFKKESIEVLTSAEIVETKASKDGVVLHLKERMLEADMILCAAGRVPNTSKLGLDKAGVEVDERGYIVVNEAFETSQKHIYAAGDCIDTPGYAHLAATEAKIAAHNIINNTAEANLHVNPSVIFSRPQVASCGISEAEAKAKGLDIEVKKAYFKTNAKAKIMGDDGGFVKAVISAKEGRLLGAAIVGVEAAEIVHLLSAAIERKQTLEELGGMIYAHPTLSEIIRYLL